MMLRSRDSPDDLLGGIFIGGKREILKFFRDAVGLRAETIKSPEEIIPFGVSFGIIMKSDDITFCH